MTSMDKIAMLYHILNTIGPVKNVLELQKTIYLLQEMGIDTRFYFKWYVMGPYCDDLSDTIEYGRLYGLLDYDGDRESATDIHSTGTDRDGITESRTIENKYPLYVFMSVFGRSERDITHIFMSACLNYLYNNDRKWRSIGHTREQVWDDLLGRRELSKDFTIGYQIGGWSTLESLGLVERCDTDRSSSLDVLC